jgi:hypothetical protein
MEFFATKFWETEVTPIIFLTVEVHCRGESAVGSSWCRVVAVGREMPAVLRLVTGDKISLQVVRLELIRALDLRHDSLEKALSQCCDELGIAQDHIPVHLVPWIMPTTVRPFSSIMNPLRVPPSVLQRSISSRQSEGSKTCRDHRRTFNIEFAVFHRNDLINSNSLDPLEVECEPK